MRAVLKFSVCFSACFMVTATLATSKAGAQEKSSKQTPSLEKDVIENALALLNPAQGWSVTPDQTISYDKKLWTQEALSDGSEIYVYQNPTKEPAGFEHKRVILRDGKALSSVSTYVLSPKKGERPAEDSASVLFSKGRLYSITKCTDDGSKKGRDCLTVTRNICNYVKEPSSEIPAAISEELKILEVRALATILTLRGPDHQLENVALHGSRLGLKDPLQTTKGKLLAKDKNQLEQSRKAIAALCKTAHLDAKQDDSRVAAMAEKAPASPPKGSN